jgi:hypothetical protein
MTYLHGPEIKRGGIEAILLEKNDKGKKKGC